MVRQNRGSSSILHVANKGSRVISGEETGEEMVAALLRERPVH